MLGKVLKAAESQEAVYDACDGSDLFSTVFYLLTGTVIIRVINYHYIKLSPSVMTALSALIWGSILMALQRISPEIASSLGAIRDVLQKFPEIVMDYMLGFLLFAAAIEVDLGRLGRVRSTVIALALGGTVTSTLLVGVLTWLLLRRLIPLPLEICLLFGTVVSPTDPVAVTSVLNDKPELISTSTRYFVWCESLFNDAVGVVLYYGMLNFVLHAEESLSQKLWAVLEVFLRECAVGVLVGLAMGYVAYLLIHAVDEPVLENTIPIVLVGMLEVICLSIDASIPLACICAGLLIGNYGSHFGFSPEGLEGFHQIWRFIDETLNSILFLLIGLMTIFWKPNVLGWGKYIILMLAIIPISLFARSVSIAAALSGVVRLEKIFRRPFRHPSVRYRAGTIAVLTWGGLRGGLTIALALGVIRNTAPLSSASGNVVFLMTYTIVVWSLVQGLLFERACHLIQDAGYWYQSQRRLMTQSDDDEPQDSSGSDGPKRSTSLLAGLTRKTLLYSEDSAGFDKMNLKARGHERMSSMAEIETLRPLPSMQDFMRSVRSRIFSEPDSDEADER